MFDDHINCSTFDFYFCCRLQLFATNFVFLASLQHVCMKICVVVQGIVGADGVGPPDKYVSETTSSYPLLMTRSRLYFQGNLQMT